jgi:hypothetical protein
MTFDFRSGHSSILRTLDIEAIRALKATLQKGGLGQGKKASGQPAMLSGVMSRGAIGVFGAQRRFPDSHAPALSSVNLPPSIQVKREVEDRKLSELPGSSKVRFVCSELSSNGSRKSQAPLSNLLTSFSIIIERYMYEKLSERSDGKS